MYAIRSYYAESEKNDMETLRGNALTANLLHYFDETDINEWIFYPSYNFV